jgi:hypothetical protein
VGSPFHVEKFVPQGAVQGVRIQLNWPDVGNAELACLLRYHQWPRSKYGKIASRVDHRGNQNVYQGTVVSHAKWDTGEGQCDRQVDLLFCTAVF